MTRPSTPADETWLPLARPVIARLDGNWRDEDRALARLTFAELRSLSAQRLGFVERRQHWLTRRWQLRLTVQALTSNKVVDKVRAGRGVVTTASELAKSLTAAQRHVVLRCSDAEDWTNRGFGFARAWADIVANRHHCSMVTVRALERLGILHCSERQYDAGLFALTSLGLSVQFHLKSALRAGDPS